MPKLVAYVKGLLLYPQYPAMTDSIIAQPLRSIVAQSTKMIAKKAVAIVKVSKTNHNTLSILKLQLKQKIPNTFQKFVFKNH